MPPLPIMSETVEGFFIFCLGVLFIGSLTWFFSSRQKAFVNTFVPDDHHDEVVAGLAKQSFFRKGMRWMAGLQMSIGGFLLIGTILSWFLSNDNIIEIFAVVLFVAGAVGMVWLCINSALEYRNLYHRQCPYCQKTFGRDTIKRTARRSRYIEHQPDTSNPNGKKVYSLMITCDACSKDSLYHRQANEIIRYDGCGEIAM